MILCLSSCSFFISAEKSDDVAIIQTSKSKTVVDLIEEEESSKPINLDEDENEDAPFQQPMSPEHAQPQFSAEPFDSENTEPQFSSEPFEKPASPSTRNIALGSLQPMKPASDEFMIVESDQGFSEQPARPATPETIEDPERVQATADFKAGKISKAKLKKIKAKLAKKSKKQRDAAHFSKSLKADSSTQARRKGLGNIEVDYIVKNDGEVDTVFAADLDSMNPQDDIERSRYHFKRVLSLFEGDYEEKKKESENLSIDDAVKKAKSLAENANAEYKKPKEDEKEEEDDEETLCHGF